MGHGARRAERALCHHRPRIAVALSALVVVALHTSAITRYGYFRDELYYLACAQHLALGYVDHPPFSIALLALVVPTLASVATLVLTGEMVWAIGGGLFATAVACTAQALAPVVLAFGHFYSMNSLDGVFWTLGAWLFLRTLEAPAPRRWCALGAVLGLGLENKASILWLGAGMAVALVGYRRDLLKTRGPWLASLIAAIVFAPNVIWETLHGWPTLEFARNAMEGKYQEHSVIGFFAGVADVMNPASLPLFALGGVAPFAMRPLHPWRPLACITLTVTLILAASKTAKPEYLAAAFPLAFAPAGVALEVWLSRWPRIRWGVLVPVVARGAISVPFVVPILPIERFLAYQAALGAQPTSAEKKDIGPLPQLYADMFGWNELASAVAVAAATLTPEERAHAGVLSRTGYGAAATIELLGPPRGLPPGLSGHNNFYLWGPREADGRAMIVMGGELSWAEERFTSVVAVTAYDCPLCMPYERHKTIFVARGMKQPLGQFWAERRYFE
jgi:Dolichyl-phosphate-mannose-protein mannosyltransferase